MPGDAGCLTDGDYDHSSKMEQKRGHQWLMDSAGSEMFSNKKQAIEVGTERSGSGGVMDASLWHNAPNFQSVSGPLYSRMFGSETASNINLIDRNVASVDSGNMQMGRHNFSNQYGYNSSTGLSVSQATEDPAEVINFGGIRKVKVSQVRDSRNDNPSLGQFYSGSTQANAYNRINSNTISLGSSYTNVDENTIPIGATFGKEDGSFISMGNSLHKGDGSFILMGHYSKGDDSILSVGQPLAKGDANFMTMTPSYGSKESNAISMTSSCEKKQENFISTGSMYDKADNNFISMGPSYANNDENIMSIGSTFEKADSNVTSVGSIQDKGDSSVLSIGQNFCRSDINTISFDGFPVNPEVTPSGGIVSSYDPLPNHQSSNNASAATANVDIIQSNNAPSTVNNGQTAPPKNAAAKNKEPKGTKKATSNSFPSNVKSLLSTGMLDGVPVKYVSWSREKNLKATIKGTGYLCGCDECNFSKVVNAYEFERHANCKTKHPNNHIYFENGKTIYAVVQELKNTPQEMLFDAIQNVTGSPINQKNFHIWKESYQAATRELQRIYGKDEVVVPP